MTRVIFGHSFSFAHIMVLGIAMSVAERLGDIAGFAVIVAGAVIIAFGERALERSS